MTHPRMQRAHFTLIADRLRDAFELARDSQSAGGRRIVVYLAHEFARELRYTNPQFDADRFLRVRRHGIRAYSGEGAPVTLTRTILVIVAAFTLYALIMLWIG